MTQARRTAPYHVATLDALRHAIDVREDAGSFAIDVAKTDAIGKLGDAVVLGPGTPYNDPRAADDVITDARARGVPLVATWGGFQHVLVEHARNLVGIHDATHAEYGATGTSIVTLLACSLNGVRLDVSIRPGTRLESIYEARTATEQTTCNYGLEPTHARIASSHGMRVSAVDDIGEVRAVERVDHRFFVGTLYQPQLTSAPGAPHPIWRAFLAAAVA